MSITLKKPFYSRGDFFPREVFFILGMYALMLFLFEFARAVMLARNYGLASHIPANILLKSFIVGMRFDLAVASYLLIPLFVFLFLFKGRVRAYVVGLFAALVSIVIFTSLAEVEFYRELQMRFNIAIFEYASHPEIVGGMAWAGYPVVKYFLLWVVLTALTAGVSFALYKAFLAEKNPVTNGSPVIRGFSAFMVLVLMIFASRGGFQNTPLRWGDAYFSDETFANNLALNGAYTIGRSGLDKFGKHVTYWVKTFSAEESVGITRGMLMLPAEKDLHTESLPLLRSEDPGESRKLLVKGAGDKPVNVVIIMMESFSGRLTGALGDKHGITPEFDSLASRGVLFRRAFSNGSHTHQGVFATLTSFPNLPSFEYLMNTMYANQEFSGLPTILSDKGYGSVFLYNGLFSWDNKQGFFRQHGIDKFVGTHEYVNPTFVDPVWGVSDHDVFVRANEEFKALSQKGPFFGAILTLSNHTPFNLPPLPFPRIKSGDAYENRYNAMKYADWALGDFFKRASKEDYFKNTIFVMVGDHGIGTDMPITNMSLDKFNVPLLFYSPLLMQKGVVRDTVASQVDIGPSVLGLIGMATPHQAWGRNLFSSAVKDEGFAVIKHSGGDDNVAIIRGDRALIMSPVEKPAMYSYTLDFPPKVAVINNGEVEQKVMLEKSLKAYVQAGITMLKSRKIGVGNNAHKSVNVSWDTTSATTGATRQ